MAKIMWHIHIIIYYASVKMNQLCLLIPSGRNLTKLNFEQNMLIKKIHTL